MSLDHLMNVFYRILSIIYLNSYSTKYYKSIYNYYMSYLSIKSKNNQNKKCFFRLMPIKDQLRFIITIIGCGYYISINSIQYSDTASFILGDILITHMDQIDPLWNHFRKNMAWLFGYTGILFGYGVYQTLNIKNNKAFQTFILFTIEAYDNFSIEKLYEKNPMKYSRSTAILFIYQECKIGLNLANFRKLFIQIQCCAIIFNFLLHMIGIYIEMNPNRFDYHPLWHYIIRFISLHLQAIIFYFLCSIVYMPLCLIYYTISLGFKTIQLIRHRISNHLKKYQSIMMIFNIEREKYGNNSTIIQRKILLMTRIEKNLFRFYSIYQRLIIFIEECQKYYSKLFLISIMCTILSSQIILKSLRFIRDDDYIIIILYYLLAIDYIINIFLSFTISLFNKHLNSIRYDLQQTICLMNCSSPSFRNKFQMLMYYERLVYRGKLWGIQIGAITVMTTATFSKLILTNARFTMLTNKLF
ncbi:hypothetical protein DERP_009928 [Dermatophagoides pteronyssinus]|uniref:Odorant receptor n=1 Tax=Dermatophagoides pteronyssinus TaxID=6956 RepID=A0ABQ8J2H0_DERPT|nr:hypothetical protein DERP_009928 [Dermatophagoides pteronyssinus]